MDTILKDLPQMGIVMAVTVVVAGIVVLLLKFIDKIPSKKEEADTELIKELAKMVMQASKENAEFNSLHNERSMVFQKQVQEAHKAMMEEVSAVMQMIVIQNGKMEYYTNSIAEIKQGIREACEKASARMR